MQAGHDPARQPDTASLQDLGERWRRIMKQLRVPGMAVAVILNDKVILLEAFGIRDPHTKAPVTPDTVFFIGDNTEPFVVMALLQLADEGRVDLDAPVKKYVPRFELANADLSTTLTVRDLLSQRWGLENFTLNFGLDYTGEIDDELFYRLLRKVRPEEKFKRSSIIYATLGRVIPAVSGMSWKDYVKKRILAPAGMNNTFCQATEMYARPDVALPVHTVGDAWRVLETRKSDRTMHAGGGMGASVADLARWLRLNLNGGQIDGRRILSEKRVKEMQTQQVEAPRRIFQFDREGFGLGWDISSYQGERVVSQFGVFPGYRSNISILPDHKIGIVVLSNASGAARHFSDLVACDILDRLLGFQGEDLVPRLDRLVYRERDRRSSQYLDGTNPAKNGGLTLDPQAYVGEYVSDTWGRLYVEYKDGLLIARIGDLKVGLVSSGPDWFAALVTDRRFSGRFIVTDAKRVSGVNIERGPVSMNFTR
jgi:CubicO group peptidase (beta-lactamase class C family)